MKPTPKWRSLGERVAKLQKGERIVLECDGNAGRWVAQMPKGRGCWPG